jgi:hypothetical protein
VGDNEDAFPKDPNCQQWGQHGCGGDKDKDGIPDATDAYPTDKTNGRDTDSDGVPDVYDLFKSDPHEYKDSDGDGVGDNADDFPTDPNCTKTGVHGCGGDRDGDGVLDHNDKFPDDPKEWKDSDLDGVGDNEDAFPNDPRCQRKGQKGCTTVIINASRSVAGGMDKKVVKSKSRPDGLPEQGYNEAVKGAIQHLNMETHTGDWLHERPTDLGDEDTESTETARICEENPNTVWCRLYLRKQRDR